MRRAASLPLLALLAWGCASAPPSEPQPAAAPVATSTAPAREAEPFPGARPPPDIEPTVVAYEHYRDPLIRLNRGVFAFNDFSYRYALIPLAKGYDKLPAGARRGVRNFFHNLKTPVYLLNHALQGQGAAAARTLGRFLLNTTAGIGGLFDPARDWLGWEREEAYLHQTLAGWGVGYGCYVVLPLLGPSDLRSGVSLGAEFFLSPVAYLLGPPESYAVGAFGPFQEFSPRAESYETLRAKTKDPYLFFRNLHLQGIQRDAEH